MVTGYQKAVRHHSFPQLCPWVLECSPSDTERISVFLNFCRQPKTRLFSTQSLHHHPSTSGVFLGFFPY